MNLDARQVIARAGVLLVQGVAILLISLVLALGLLELWARAQPRRYFVEFDPVLGFRNQPGATGVYRGRWFLATNPHIDAPIRINALGLRGPEREAAKAPGTARLLVLGDSFVQAFEVPWEATFYEDLEARSKASGRFLEAFPMGVNGYGQAQQLLWLQREGLAWDPDFVLLVMFLANDVTDNSQAIGSGASRPYFDLVDGELVQVARPSESARMKYWVADHLRAYLLYRELAVRFEAARDVARQLGWVNTPQGQGGGIDAETARRLDHAWEVTTALIEEIARESRAAGAGFGLAYHDNFPTGSAETGRERMGRFCAERDLDCLDLSEGLAGSEDHFVPEDHHWSEKGHARVAEMIWSRWGPALVGERDAGGPLLDVPELP